MGTGLVAVEVQDGATTTVDQHQPESCSLNQYISQVTDIDRVLPVPLDVEVELARDLTLSTT